MIARLDDTLAVIDAVTEACAQCNRPRGDSPSDDFCSEPCQRRWLQTSATEPQKVLGYGTLDTEAIRAIHDRLTRELRFLAQHFEQRVIPAVSLVFQRFSEGMQGASLSFAAFDESSEETPQQRALRLQRERNTGPRQERYAKRGRP